MIHKMLKRFHIIFIKR